MGSPYSHENSLRIYDQAVKNWLGGLIVDYGRLTYRENPTDATTERSLSLGHKPILRVVAAPHRALAEVSRILIDEKWLDQTTTDGQRIRDAEDVAKRLTPYPYCTIQRIDEDQAPARSHVYWYKFLSSKRNSVEAHRWPLPLDLVYQIDFYSKRIYTISYIREWIAAQFGQLGSSPYEMMLEIDHLDPWKKQLHGLTLLSVQDNSDLLDIADEPVNRRIKISVTVKLNGLLFRNPTEATDGDMALIVSSEWANGGAIVSSSANLFRVADLYGKDVTVYSPKKYSLVDNRAAAAKVTNVDANSRLVVSGLPVPNTADPTLVHLQFSLIADTAGLVEVTTYDADGALTSTRLVTATTTASEFSALHWVEAPNFTILIRPLTVGFVELWGFSAWPQIHVDAAPLISDPLDDASWVEFETADVTEAGGELEIAVLDGTDYAEIPFSSDAIVVVRVNAEVQLGEVQVSLEDVDTDSILDSRVISATGAETVALVGSPSALGSGDLRIRIKSTTVNPASVRISALDGRRYHGLPLCV